MASLITAVAIQKLDVALEFGEARGTFSWPKRSSEKTSGSSGRGGNRAQLRLCSEDSRKVSFITLTEIVDVVRKITVGRCQVWMKYAQRCLMLWKL